MMLKIQSTITKNERTGDYLSVAGENTFLLFDDTGTLQDVYTHDNVLWTGKGSPFPTPPGGPWRAVRTFTRKLGDCFLVDTPFESEVFIHLAHRISYGCFIIKPTEAGITFLKVLLMNPTLQVTHLPLEDVRSLEEKKENPIDYSDIISRGKII